MHDTCVFKGLQSVKVALAGLLQLSYLTVSKAQVTEAPALCPPATLGPWTETETEKLSDLLSS